MNDTVDPIRLTQPTTMAGDWHINLHAFSAHHNTLGIVLDFNFQSNGLKLRISVPNEQEKAHDKATLDGLITDGAKTFLSVLNQQPRH